MAYTVLALKWRPQTFDDVIGQNHIITTLKSALEKKRLAHAYLFSGPRGVGKTSTARILAKSLNCKEGPTLEPCQKCASCLEIAQGRSLDVIEIDGASNRGIDEIRTLRENVKFAPVQGKFKIYIIDEVHMLTTEAFNALLKTLEEPPEYVKFFFATTQPNKVIPTILSRCQRFDFRRVPVMDIITQLEKIVKAENIKVGKEVLFAVASSSDGSLRDAESLLDQLVSFSQDSVSLKDVISVLGLVEQDVLFEVADKIIQKNALGALEVLSRVINDGKDVSIFLPHLIEHFRNLMMAKVTKADSKLIDLPQEICERLLQQAQAFSMEEIFTIFNTLVNTQDVARRLDSQRIPLEIALVKLAHDKKLSASLTSVPIKRPLSEIKPRVEEVKKIQPMKAEDNQNDGSSEAFENIVPVSVEQIKDIWQIIIDNLGKIKMSVATYLNEGNLIKVEDNILTISFPKNYSLHKESLEKKENKELIESLFSKMSNSVVRVKFILSSDVVKNDSGPNNPFIKSVMDTFKGRIIKEE